MNVYDDIRKLLSSLTFDNMYISVSDIKYKLGTDSKLISKIIEMVICSTLKKYCTQNKIQFEINPIQNSYPDFILYHDNQPIAVDIKTTYRISENKINGCTLGTYKGYFRDRSSNKNIRKPYSEFTDHLCIVALYDRTEDSVLVKDIFITEKWKIASNRTGSGNTCNIGSMTNIDALRNGPSFFSSKAEFDTYWMNYE